VGKPGDPLRSLSLSSLPSLSSLRIVDDDYDNDNDNDNDEDGSAVFRGNALERGEDPAQQRDEQRDDGDGEERQ
jgi:hypothetical protein